MVYDQLFQVRIVSKIYSSKPPQKSYVTDLAKANPQGSITLLTGCLFGRQLK